MIQKLMLSVVIRESASLGPFGHGVLAFTRLLFLSLQLLAPDLSDNILADLLLLSDFSLVFPEGFSLELVLDLDFRLLTHCSLLARSAASGS